MDSNSFKRRKYLNRRGLEDVYRGIPNVSWTVGPRVGNLGWDGQED